MVPGRWLAFSYTLCNELLLQVLCLQCGGKFSLYYAAHVCVTSSTFICDGRNSTCLVLARIRTTAASLNFFLYSCLASAWMLITFLFSAFAFVVCLCFCCLPLLSMPYSSSFLHFYFCIRT